MRYLVVILLSAACFSRAAMVADLRAEVAKDPGAVKPNVALTEALLKEERFDEADGVIEAALEKNPAGADLHRVHGDLLFREGQVFDAEKEYRVAYKADPKNARALYGVGRVFSAVCLRKDAEKYIRGAYKMAPDDEAIQEGLSRIQDPAEKVAGWRKELEELKDKESDRAKRLERAIAIQTALNGKHAFELGSPYQHHEAVLYPLANGVRLYGYGLNISINGVKSQLQLDTGAGGVTISSRFAEKAGVKRIADGEIRGIGNQDGKKVWTGYVDEIAIGDLVLRNCVVTVSDRGSVVDAGGLIGSDVFDRFLVKMNFFTRRLELDPLPGPAWDGFTAVNRYDGPELKDFAQMLLIYHDLLIPTAVSEARDKETTPGLFLLDTGAGLNNVSTRLAANVGKTHDNDYVRVKGLSGKVKKVYEADRIVLTFAGFRQTNLDMVAFDLGVASRSAGTEIAGILGMPVIALFGSITLDYRDGRVRFEYRQ